MKNSKFLTFSILLVAFAGVQMITADFFSPEFSESALNVVKIGDELNASKLASRPLLNETIKKLEADHELVVQVAGKLDAEGQGKDLVNMANKLVRSHQSLVAAAKNLAKKLAKA